MAVIKTTLELTRDEIIAMVERKHNIKFKKLTVSLSARGIAGEIEK